MIRPLDPKHGVGFWSLEPVSPEMAKGYRYEQVGRYHNYYVTFKAWEWPEKQKYLQLPIKIDAFSPNLNKELHVGHLRNLALAKSISMLFYGSEMVSLFGATLGVKKAAMPGISYWCDFLGFVTTAYYDVLLPDDVVETRPATLDDGIEPNADGIYPMVWDGPNGPVIVQRSDGKKLYAFYDLAFAKEACPTHYITGSEQVDHFYNLGLGDKHYPMGLILGPDGKKLKSRDGNALAARDALEMVEKNLNPETYCPTHLAWNVLAWNFLHTSRSKDVKFEVEKWTQPDSPGMYISYTYARLGSALDSALLNHVSNAFTDFPDETLMQPDIDIAGFAAQHQYWVNQAVEKLDPAGLANYTHDLARKLSSVYESEKIVNGRYGFQKAMMYSHRMLGHCMTLLGMKLLTKV